MLDKNKKYNFKVFEEDEAILALKVVINGFEFIHHFDDKTLTDEITISEIENEYKDIIDMAERVSIVFYGLTGMKTYDYDKKTKEWYLTDF